MIKEVTKSGKELLYSIADRIPQLFPKRARRVKWANSLPEEMGTKLIDNTQSPIVKYSALGWGCMVYFSNTKGTIEDLQVDGVKFEEYMPASIRAWYGLTDLSALKIQSLNLNGVDRKKVQKLIKEV